MIKARTRVSVGTVFLVTLALGFIPVAQALQSPPGKEDLRPNPEEREDSAAEVDAIRRDLDELREQIDNPEKDFWDKLEATSALISGIIIALIGFYATQVYNRRQKAAELARKDSELTVLQVQTVEKFFPHLASGDDTKVKAAIQAIAALGNEGLATNVARVFGGSGSAEALGALAAHSDLKVSQSAEAALSELFTSIRPSVVRIESEGKLVATGFFVSAIGLTVTTAHVASMLKSGNSQIRTSTGEVVTASIVRVDERRDLALLKADVQREVVPTDLTGARIERGDQVVAIGQSAEAAWVAVAGTVAAKRQRHTTGIPEVSVSIRSVPGFSGAPVLNTRGILVGIIQAYSAARGLTFLIPAEEIRSAFGRDLGFAA